MFNMHPDEVGWRFSQHDIAEILAFENMKANHERQAQRQSELEAEAAVQRRNASNG